jgi:hypothetical protein
MLPTLLSLPTIHFIEKSHLFLMQNVTFGKFPSFYRKFSQLATLTEMLQVVSQQLDTVEARVQFHGGPCAISIRHSGNGAGSFPSTSDFPRLLQITYASIIIGFHNISILGYSNI